jgi:hypothetical protein
MKYLLPLAFLFLFVNAKAQDWADMMQQPNANFYAVQEAFNQYWSTKDITEKGKGYKPFKRWEYLVEKRVYPSGDLSLLGQNQKNFDEFLKTYQQNSSANKNIGGSNAIMSTTWTPMGPFGPMSGVASNGFPRKAGRLNFITFHPAGTNTIYVGAPAGGLWVSTNAGTSWTTGTDNLSVIGCSDLAIDPTNPQIMYLATGDGNANDTWSIGVLKSTDGGLTWNATGLSYTPNLQRLVRRLLINPTNPQIVIAATNAGIYRTTNGGATWTQAASANTYDMEFKPGNPNVVYACGTSFYKSTNAGTSFTVVTSGAPPASALSRMAIAVTPADTNYVYLLAAQSSANSYGFYGFYRSVNAATSFSVMATTPNLLANDANGTGAGGQGWYDLCIGASPLNKNEVVVGGVNVWRTTNGGTSWADIGYWIGTGSPPYVHADHHDLEYTPTGTLYNANDGGIFRYNGTNAWTDVTANMNIAQIYKIGTSKISANLWITGHQDNGSNIYNSGTYNASLAGDGMDCFIDWNNNNNMFASQYNGSFNRSINGGTSWSSATSGMTGSAAWVAPWKQDPTVAATLYAGRSQMWKSVNSGASWTQLTATGGSGQIVEFAIAPSNNQVMYVIHGTSIRKTTDGGATWTNVTTGVPVGSAAPTFITIDPTDPNTVFVTCSGYSAGNKVFRTTNGGTTWTNISYNLPNLPANCSVYEPGSNDRVYIGMDVGVYYIDNSATSWTLYNGGLPNVPVSDMEISAAAPGKIRAATYGRGVYEVDVVPNIAPVSNFTYTAANLCSNQALQFTDLSSNFPTSWSWSVSPSAGVAIASSTSKNPTINFPGAGTYVVAMTSSNSAGSGGLASQTITVISSPTMMVANSSQTICAGGSVTYTASGATSYVWSSGGGTSASAAYTPTSSTSYTVTGTSGVCSSTAAANVMVNPLPLINISGSSTLCAGNSLVLNAGGASTYTWSTGPSGATISVSPTITTTYSVTGTATWGCSNFANKTVTVNPSPSVNATTSNSNICAGQSALLNASGATSYTWNPGSQTGSAVTFTPGSTTTYTCIGANGFGCTGTSMVTVSVSTCAGIEKVTSENGMYSVFPNPTSGKLTIQFNVTKSVMVNVELVDLVGKVVMKQAVSFTPSDASHQLNLSALNDGMYILRLTSDEGSQLIRIVKD